MEDTVEAIVRKNMLQINLPERCYSYIAGMILEDPPFNAESIQSLLIDFLEDGFQLSNEHISRISGIMFEEFAKIGLVQTQRIERIVAEMMPFPVVIKDYGSNQEIITADYIDPFLGIQRASVIYHQNDKAKKNNVKRQAFEEQKEQIPEPQIRRQLPPPRVNHRKGEVRTLDIIVDRVSLMIGGKSLLNSAPLKLAYGRKYGLIGRNGIGKTTLLSALAAGEIEKAPKNISILYVEQEVHASEKTVLETLLETDIERAQLLEEEKVCLANNDMDKIQQIYERLIEIDADTAESRAATILAGLGFTQEMQNEPTSFLSGGWRMRVALARALYTRPDVLLLDEPTNHLDLETCIWLEDCLNNYPHTVVIVSHARDFLNRVSTDIIHFFGETLTYYRGNYDQFEKTRREKLLQQKRAHDAQQSKIEHMQEFINKFRCNAKRASLVQSRLKALNRMDMIDDVMDDPASQFIFPQVEKLNPPLIRIDDGNFSYGNKSILSDININVDTDSRIALLGHNGCGKSTLLKLLTEELQLKSGSYYRHRRLRLGLYTQHHMESLNLSVSALEQLAHMFPGTPNEVIRQHLGSFGISGNLALRPMYYLSGGQKSRVSLAALVFNQPHVLLLDEPTNHLDLDAVNALIIALNAYGGGLVVVSHDQHFVSSVCDDIFVIRRGKVKKFQGTFMDYRKSIKF